MVRRGRSASPPPAPRRAASPAPRAPQRSAAPPAAPAQHAQPPMVQQQAQPPMMMQQQPQQPSMFKQMAATAGGVAIGSAVGHTMGHALTGMMGGGGKDEAAHDAAPAQQYGDTPHGGQEPTGACAWEIKQFLQCAQNQSDLTLCDGFNEALRQCKESSRI